MQPNLAPMPSETTFFRDGPIAVTSARVQIGGTMYPIQGITALNLQEIPSQRSGAIVLLVLGVVVCFTGIGAVLGVPLALWSLWQAIKAKPEYILHLHTSGGQFQAVKSKDKQLVMSVNEAINNALASRR